MGVTEMQWGWTYLKHWTQHKYIEEYWDLGVIILSALIQMCDKSLYLYVKYYK